MCRQIARYQGNVSYSSKLLAHTVKQRLKANLALTLWFCVVLFRAQQIFLVSKPTGNLLTPAIRPRTINHCTKDKQQWKTSTLFSTVEKIHLLQGWNLANGFRMSLCHCKQKLGCIWKYICKISVSQFSESSLLFSQPAVLPPACSYGLYFSGAPEEHFWMWNLGGKRGIDSYRSPVCTSTLAGWQHPRPPALQGIPSAALALESTDTAEDAIRLT